MGKDDAPAAPATDKKTKPKPVAGSIEVENLADILTTEDEASTPEPILLSWTAGGKDYTLKVECQYPDDPRGFPLAYVMEAEKSKQPEVGRDGETTFPNKGCHELYLRQRIIKKPIWLKNPKGFEDFAKKVPPHVPATLHRKLELVGGLDADFFVDYNRYLEPAVLTMLSSRSAPGSASSPPPSAPPTPTTETSSPSGSESAKPPSGDALTVSTTTSG